MTTTAQVRQLLKPFLASRDDIVLIGRWIILRPVRHVLRIVLIDRRSDKNVLNPDWGAMHLFDVSTMIRRLWGSGDVPPHLFAPRGRPWDITRAGVLEDLSSTIEEALTKLRTINSPQAIVDLNYEICRYQKVGPEFIFWNNTGAHLAMLAAMGDFEAITPELREKISRLDAARMQSPEPEDFERVAFLKQLLALVTANDRAGVAAHLHDQERRTVERLKLTHLWEPTPFPVEEDGAVSSAHPD